MLNLYGIPQTEPAQIIMSHTTLGDLGELTVAERLKGYGFDVHKPSDKHCGDLIARLVRANLTQKIEIKTARRGSRGTFQFCLNRTASLGFDKTDHKDSDLLILLCVESDFSVVGFCIPSERISSKKIEFKNPKTCKYRQYLAWE